MDKLFLDQQGLLALLECLKKGFDTLGKPSFELEGDVLTITQGSDVQKIEFPHKTWGIHFDISTKTLTLDNTAGQTIDLSAFLTSADVERLITDKLAEIPSYNISYDNTSYQLSISDGEHTSNASLEDLINSASEKAVSEGSQYWNDSSVTFIQKEDKLYIRLSKTDGSSLDIDASSLGLGLDLNGNNLSLKAGNSNISTVDLSSLSTAVDMSEYSLAADTENNSIVLNKKDGETLQVSSINIYDLLTKQLPENIIPTQTDQVSIQSGDSYIVINTEGTNYTIGLNIDSLKEKLQADGDLLSDAVLSFDSDTKTLKLTSTKGGINTSTSIPLSESTQASIYNITYDKGTGVLTLTDGSNTSTATIEITSHPEYTLVKEDSSIALKKDNVSVSTLDLSGLLSAGDNIIIEGNTISVDKTGLTDLSNAKLTYNSSTNVLTLIDSTTSLNTSVTLPASSSGSGATYTLSASGIAYAGSTADTKVVLTGSDGNNSELPVSISHELAEVNNRHLSVNSLKLGDSTVRIATPTPHLELNDYTITMDYGFDSTNNTSDTHPEISQAGNYKETINLPTFNIGEGLQWDELNNTISVDLVYVRTWLVDNGIAVTSTDSAVTE